MPIGTVGYPSIQQFPYENPYLAGMTQGNQLSQGFLENIARSLQNQALQNKLPYVGPQAEAELKYTQAQTPHLEAQTKKIMEEIPWIGREAASQIALRSAQSGHLGAETERLRAVTPLERQLKEIELKYAEPTAQANIADKMALAKYREMGGAGMGVGAKDQAIYQSLVAKDNPQLSPDQVYEASNVIASGGDILSDGTKLNPASFNTMSALDRVNKARTTGAIMTQAIKANQAEAELEEISKFTNDKFKPYGTTYFNRSPEQIADTFKNDDASQKRLGEFIGSQALQYEAAQIRNRMAGGEPGITATQELMGKSGQIIHTFYPRLSAKAREQAIKTIDEGLSKALKARQKIGVGASNLFIPQKEQSSKNTNSNVKIINGKKYQLINGKVYEI